MTASGATGSFGSSAPAPGRRQSGRHQAGASREHPARGSGGSGCGSTAPFPEVNRFGQNSKPWSSPRTRLLLRPGWMTRTDSVLPRTRRADSLHGGGEPAPVKVACAFCSFVVVALVEEAHAAFEAHQCDRPKRRRP
jgi:hypothetical protein